MERSSTHDVRPSTTRDGNGVTVTSTTIVGLLEYQPVTSHGNEAVSDADTPTIVEHSSTEARLKPSAYNPTDRESQKGLVHVPIHNPPATFKTLYLQDILVECNCFYDATVESVTLYYNSDEVVKTVTKKGQTFYIDFTDKGSIHKTYVAPKGISVALDLRFPDEKSSINLISVTLVYKAANPS